ncbi:MAG: hypothetical protein ACREVM_09815, partial [Burkholderiales bacterium]
VGSVKRNKRIFLHDINTLRKNGRIWIIYSYQVVTPHFLLLFPTRPSDSRMQNSCKLLTPNIPRANRRDRSRGAGGAAVDGLAVTSGLLPMVLPK